MKKNENKGLCSWCGAGECLCDFALECAWCGARAANDFCSNTCAEFFDDDDERQPARVRVRFGGSHRKYERQWSVLASLTGERHSLPLRAGLGSKFFEVTILDTPANRERVKEIGATISRNQAGGELSMFHGYLTKIADKYVFTSGVCGLCGKLCGKYQPIEPRVKLNESEVEASGLIIENENEPVRVRLWIELQEME